MAKDAIADFIGSVFGSRSLPEDPLKPRARRFRPGGNDPESVYGKFAYRSEASIGSIPRVAEIDAVGDTLLLDELVGSEALYVRIGEYGNPWVRMEEGDTLTRRFDKVFVTVGAAGDADLPGLARGPVEATFLNSWGKIKEKGERSDGFRRGFKTFRGTATSAESSLFSPLVALAPGAPIVIGKRGGTLIVRNRDLGNTLLLRHGVPGILGADDYFELYPGETWELRLAGRIHTPSDTIIVACVSGSCKYGFACSGFDVDRADLNQTLMSGI